AVAATALLTGALHLDALADTADALGGMSRGRALEIMRDHQIGSFGAVALVVDLIIRASVIGGLATAGIGVAALASAGACPRAILIRHADPAEDARGRCYGRTDIALSPRGERRARHLGNMLRRMPVDAVYTSPSRRAVDTAAALAAAHDLTPVELDDLRELDFGACEGRTYDELAAEEPELFRTW